MRYLLLLLTGLMTVACSDRERTNPLDPDNPITHGAPTGFQAVANRRNATLTWDPMVVDDLIGYNIYKSAAGEPFQVTTVIPDSTRFTDKDLLYDTRYLYAVQAVTYDTSRRTAPDSLIPGPYNFWIADFYNYAVWRISYDGAHVLGRKYFNSPDAVVYQPGEGKGRVWIADYYDKAVYYMDVHFTGIEPIALTGRPIDMVADTISGTIHVLQRFPDQITQVGPDGTIRRTLEAPDSVDIDAALAVDAAAGFLWFSNPVSPISGDIYRCDPFSSGGEWELMASLAYPRQIEADPAAGGCWVATDSGVVRIDAAGQDTTYLPQLNILDISLNPANGDCYYIGRSHQDGQWQTGRLYGPPDPPDPQIILGADYSALTGIQVLPGEGQAGFLVSQVSTGRILRFDREGRLLGLLEGFGEFLRFTLE